MFGLHYTILNQGINSLFPLDLFVSIVIIYPFVKVSNRELTRAQKRKKDPVFTGSSLLIIEINRGIAPRYFDRRQFLRFALLPSARGALLSS